MSKLKRLIEQRETVNARIKQEQNKLRADERRSDTRRRPLVIPRFRSPVVWRLISSIFGVRRSRRNRHAEDGPVRPQGGAP